MINDTGAGTTGFSIGKNVSASQNWNGDIAELVILDRAYTIEERYFWVQYVKGYYTRF